MAALFRRAMDALYLACVVVGCTALVAISAVIPYAVFTRYVLNSAAQLRRVPDAIALTYEDLCRPEFSDPALDAFFGRPIRLDDPKPPTSAETYVSNWPEFLAFIEAQQRELTARAGRQP